MVNSFSDLFGSGTESAQSIRRNNLKNDWFGMSSSSTSLSEEVPLRTKKLVKNEPGEAILDRYISKMGAKRGVRRQRRTTW